MWFISQYFTKKGKKSQHFLQTSSIKFICKRCQQNILWVCIFTFLAHSSNRRVKRKRVCWLWEGWVTMGCHYFMPGDLWHPKNPGNSLIPIHYMKKVCRIPENVRKACTLMLHLHSNIKYTNAEHKSHNKCVSVSVNVRVPFLSFCVRPKHFQKWRSVSVKEYNLVLKIKARISFD